MINMNVIGRFIGRLMTTNPAKQKKIVACNVIARLSLAFVDDTQADDHAVFVARVRSSAVAPLAGTPDLKVARGKVQGART